MFLENSLYVVIQSIFLKKTISLEKNELYLYECLFVLFVRVQLCMLVRRVLGYVCGSVLSRCTWKLSLSSSVTIVLK